MRFRLRHSVTPTTAYAAAVVLGLCIAGSIAGCAKKGGNDPSGACKPGEILVGAACRLLCEKDSDCASGEICGQGTDVGFCRVGQRDGVPRIDDIDGSGSADSAATGTADIAAHRILSKLIVTGDNFAGTDVIINGPSGQITGLTFPARTSQRLEIQLPASVTEEGFYRLQVRGQSGSAESTFKILRGEQGTAGYPGATYISQVVLNGTSNQANILTEAITVDTQDDNHAYPFATPVGAGIMLAVINRADHTLATTPAAGTFYTSPTTLKTALAALDTSVFITMASRGNIASWMQSGNANSPASELAASLINFGAIPGIHLMGSGDAFVFAGRKNLGAGNGVFVVTSGTASAALSLVDNNIVGNSTVNYAVCLRDSTDTNCTIPASQITGTITTDQMPIGFDRIAAWSVRDTNDNTQTPADSPTSVTVDNAVSFGSTAAFTGSTSLSNVSTLTTASNSTSTFGGTSTFSGNTSLSSVTGLTTTSGSSTTLGGTVTISGPLEIQSPTPYPCNMAGAARSALVTPTGGVSHCYGVFIPTSNVNWYQAQATCNAIGAHLSTILSDNELTAVQSLITGTTGHVTNTTKYWVGLSNYEGSPTNVLPRWAGYEPISTAPIDLPALSGVNYNCGYVADNTALRGVGSASTSSSALCNSTNTVGGFICERQAIPIIQPCAPNWWPINGGRLCMFQNLFTTTPAIANGSNTALASGASCLTRTDVTSHICTLAEMQQACAGGFKPFSATSTDGTAYTNTTTANTGIFGDLVGDNSYSAWLFNYCHLGSDADAAGVTLFGSRSYRCCY